MDGHPVMGWVYTLYFYIIPVVLVLSQQLVMYVLTLPGTDEDQSNMTKEQKDTADQTTFILKFLLLLIDYFSQQVLAGLTIYWLASNTFTRR